MYELATLDEGQGPVVVLLHAFPCDSTMWRAQGQELLRAGNRVLVPDLPGFGGSRLPEGDPSLAISAQAVFDLLDDRSVARATVAGLSMGGYVAMEMVRQQPGRLKGVALVDTKAGADGPQARGARLDTADLVEAAGDTASMAQLVPALLGATSLAERPDVVAIVEQYVRSAPPSAVAWSQRAMAARPNSLSDLSRFQGPALVLHGDEDTLSPLEEQQAMAAALPRGARREISGCGHLSAIERPGAVSAALIDFLSAV